jgi:hypothetical protein
MLRWSQAAPVALLLCAWTAATVGTAQSTASQLPAPSRAAAPRFHCPMHPDVTAAVSGRCSRCGMVLVPGDPLDAREYLLQVTAAPVAPSPGERVRLAFVVRDPETRVVVRDLTLVHERPFHLFVVSHDLEHYDHVHPEVQPDGSWAIDLVLPRRGYYKLIADFLPVGGTAQVIPRLLATADPGDLTAGRARLRPDPSLRKTADTMTLALTVPEDGLAAGREETLRFHVTDAATGSPVADLEPYLAAYGHTLVMSEDTLEYVHAHPVELVADQGGPARGGPDVTFKAMLPKPGAYRLGTQVKGGGVVTTVPFTVTVASPGS